MNSSSSLNSPQNTKDKLLSRRSGISTTGSSSTPDLNNLIGQIANSRNISKINDTQLNSSGQRRTMVNLATVNEHKKIEKNQLGMLTLI